MPTQKEQLLSAISGKTKNYDAAMNIISSNPDQDLINAIDEYGNSVFMKAMIAKNKSSTFINFILKHPNFRSFIQNAGLRSIQFRFVNQCSRHQVN